MTDYTKSTNFASKDSLLSGNPLKIVKGTEIDTEFNNIATAISTKYDSASTIPITAGGTGATTVSGARTALGVSAAGTLTSNWTVSESGGKLYFAYSGTNKASLDSSGNLVVVGNVTAYGTP